MSKKFYLNSAFFLDRLPRTLTKVKSADELNKLDQYGKSPLYLAVERQNPLVIKLLVDNKADLDLIMSNLDIQEAENTPRKLANNIDPKLLMLSKIKVLSDGTATFKQVIDQQIPDIKQRSITPDTHKSRTMVKNQEELSNFNLLNIKPISFDTEDSSSEIEELKDQSEDNMIEQINTSSSDALYYVDEYQYKNTSTSHVLHFGINTFSSIIIKEIKKHEDKLVKHIQETKKELTTGSDIKSAINQNNLAKANSYKNDSNVMLTDIELNVFSEAVKVLEITPTVLIDVFARHDKDGEYPIEHKLHDQKYLKGEIKLTKEGQYETHTVVLYKQEDKYIVIDPSNSTFSTVLVAAHDNVRVCFDPNLQIYKPSGDTGYNFSKWRDCIDIAVKLAFGINAELPVIPLLKAPPTSSIVETINSKAIKDLSIIKEVTNQKEQYNFLPKLLESECIRAKQSSNIMDSKLTTLYLKSLNSYSLSIKEKFDKIDSYTLQKLFDQSNKNKIKEYKESHDKYIKSLKSYTEVLMNYVNINDNDVVQLEEKAILGNLSDDISEWSV